MTETGTPTGFQGGWTYRRARVNLTSLDVEIEEILPDEVRHWCGGRGLNASIMRNEMPEGISPFNPDVPVCLGAGPLSGSGLPCTGALYLASIAPAPVPPNYGQITLRGSLGARLRWAGFDQVVVKGQARHPVFLEIRPGAVEVHDATDLWGREPGESAVAMQERVGAPEGGTLVIGPAGEKRVRYASLVADFSWPADGLGFGALFGAKQLKGLVFHGTGAVRPRNPEAFHKIRRKLHESLVSDPGVRRASRLGAFLPLLGEGDRAGRAPSRNFRRFSDLPSLSRFIPTGADPRLACASCPTACNRFFLRAGFPDSAPRFGGLSAEALLSLGPRLGLGDWHAVLDLAGDALRLGLDPGAFGAMAGWIAECAEEGLAGPRETGGPVRFGDAASFSKLLRTVALREGAGRYLGEGAIRTSQRLGPEASARLVRFRGMPWPSSDPRTHPGASLLFLGAPLDPDPFLYVNLVDRPELAAHYLEDVSDLPAWVRAREERKALADTLGVCSLPLASLPVWDTETLVEALHALTAADPEIFEGAGRRVLALEEMLHAERTVKEPWRMPARFIEPGPEDGEDGLEAWADASEELAKPRAGAPVS